MPSSLPAVSAANPVKATVAKEVSANETVREYIEFLRSRENPFEVLVSPRKLDPEVVASYVPEANPSVWRQLQRIIQRLRPDRIEYENDIPRSGVALILGARGSGKTATLHAIQLKCDPGHRHIVVAPTTFEPSRSFVEYLYFELLRHLKEEKAEVGSRTIDLLAEAFTRQSLVEALRGMSKVRWIALSNTGAFDFFTSLRGWRTHEVVARRAALVRDLESCGDRSLREIAKHHEVSLDLLREIALGHIDSSMVETTVGAAVRKGLYRQFVEGTLNGSGDSVFEYLYDGFARVDLQGQHPKDLYVNEVLQALIDLALLSHVPIVFAFDSLETLLQEPPDAARYSAFFTGLASLVDSHRGLTFLVFAETGHWQALAKYRGSFVEQRLNQGIVGVPEFGTVSELVLPDVTPATLKTIIAARLAPLAEEFFKGTPPQQIVPFSASELEAVVKALQGGQSSFRNGILRIRDLYAERILRRRPTLTGLNGSGLGQMEQLQATWTEVLVAGKIEASKLTGGSLGPLHQGLMLWFRSLQQEGQAGVVEVSNDTSGDHPTFGQVTMYHRQRDGAVEKIAVGFFVGQGPSMPVDLGSKLRMAVAGRLSGKIDRMIVLWPRLIASNPVEHLPAKTKLAWTDVVKDELIGKVVLRCIDPSELAVWLSLPKWRAKVLAEIPDVAPSVLDHFVVEQSKDLTKRVLPE